MIFQQKLLGLLLISINYPAQFWYFPRKVLGTLLYWESTLWKIKYGLQTCLSLISMFPSVGYVRTDLPCFMWNEQWSVGAVQVLVLQRARCLGRSNNTCHLTALLQCFGAHGTWAGGQAEGSCPNQDATMWKPQAATLSLWIGSRSPDLS